MNTPTRTPHNKRIKITVSQAFNLLIPYVKKRIREQFNAVALIVLYLLFFQIVILRVGILEAGTIAIGLGLVVVGLTFFIEGLFLGIMPLGEAIGIKLPQKTSVPVILIFAFILGIGATLAEPTIGILRAAGTSVKPWDSPLLFLFLNRFPNYLILAVAIGVGIAVLLGMLRFLYNWSLKPFIIVPVLLLLSLSIYAMFDPNLRSITGLAWDCGGITTGPVTVPLVLALGIGLCRVARSASTGSLGLGVVTLASLFPILTVLLLGLPFLHSVPAPSTEVQFAKMENRQKSAALFPTEERMIGYILKNGSVAGRAALFDNDTAKLSAFLVLLFNDGDLRQKVLGGNYGSAAITAISRKIFAEMSSHNEASAYIASKLGPTEDKTESKIVIDTVISNTKLAIRAIIPLSLFLGLVLIIIIRERPLRTDEIIMGVFFALIGLGLFNVGMELGLAKLGQQVGKVLPSTFKTIEIDEKTLVIKNFDTSIVGTSISENGTLQRIFYAHRNSRFFPVLFVPEQYDSVTRDYVYAPQRGPIDGKDKSIPGVAILFLFAFVMGFGATLAEPALTTFGLKVEELTVGVFKKELLKNSAALGVGIGMTFGLAKVLWDIPLVYLLVPPYLVALGMTLLLNEEFVNIAWDSAGVTTGPVTVPLVLAMGLGIGTQLNITEGFGILALASVWPILSVLGAGMITAHARKVALAYAPPETRGEDRP